MVDGHNHKCLRRFPTMNDGIDVQIIIICFKYIFWKRKNKRRRYKQQVVILYAPGMPDRRTLLGKASIEMRFRIPRKSAELVWLAILHCLRFSFRSHKTIHLHHPFAAEDVCWDGGGRSRRSKWNKIGRCYERGSRFVLKATHLDVLAIAARWHAGRGDGPPSEADRPGPRRWQRPPRM